MLLLIITENNRVLVCLKKIKILKSTFSKDKRISVSNLAIYTFLTQISPHFQIHTS